MVGGLWAKKFNYKDGETRVCKDCGSSFHTSKPLHRCRLCVNEKQRIIQAEKRKENPYVKKNNYPYHSDKGLGSAKQHFRNIRRRNNKAWDEGREGLTRFYSEIFEEICANGIMQWIWDRRDRETLDNNRVKRDSQIRSDYPDTRGYYE